MLQLLVAITAGFGLYKMLNAGMDYLERVHQKRQKAAREQLCRNISDTL